MPGPLEQAVRKKFGSASDPYWFKDAVIYEVHVRAFFDSNNDGIGDFQGLIQKLDYLEEMGVTCIWLLPFFPSPLRDDGYDIADYMTVHPTYGTIEDFEQFLKAAHQRNLQVMIELVINHTSDQHPWFQAARRAPKGSPERDFYVWSDTDQLYRDARIIFTDTEKSNWTWDPVAQAYFWHRFFSHQPDLNYDNPRVIEEVLRIMRYWLDMGVDALRIDAIPYLVERDGTSCENLPETHAVIKRMRAEIDAGYANRMLLAEANQWPTDVLPYFGNGDECHMAFHFPLMPRIYMALRQEDRMPITDIMAQTPPIPESCQWGLFLRNHDELTLEMVTDDERDYMYLAYSADPRMRINIGIRRRLAPLVDNNRRRIELLNSLLFSFPGTPILYYGDEIGMGDNIYLGDRNGVRTPMQWTADRNAGFSRANPARLYSPVIMDPVWGYEAINVEAQQGDPSSLLSWMRNMIALRKLFRVFGRGTQKFLEPANRKVLAYLRQLDDEIVLCVANLSRFAQPVQLDLASLEGRVPYEMLGYVEFPAITREPYPLTLGPYGFLWLELQPAPVTMAVEARMEDGLTLEAAPESAEAWKELLEGEGRAELEMKKLPEFLPRQRWFGAKSRRISSVAITDFAAAAQGVFAWVFLRVFYEDGGAGGSASDDYLAPLAMAFGAEAERIRTAAPAAVVAAVHGQEQEGILYDAALSVPAQQALLEVIAESAEISTREGAITGIRSNAFAALRGDAGRVLESRRTSAEQSNSSILYGDLLILKLFRRQQSGPNPDAEIGRYLTEHTTFRSIAPFAGAIEYRRRGDRDTSALAMLQGMVANEGDGWQWTLEELDRYFERCSALPPPRPANDAERLRMAREQAGLSLEAAEKLGLRTAQLHLALATPTHDPAFAPEPLTEEDLGTLARQLADNGQRAFAALRTALAVLPDDTVELSATILSRRSQILNRLNGLRAGEFSAVKTRVHGDYHLGQVLRSRTDFVILDFEGEPARSLEERRAKASPLKDVAGMLRSFSYAAYAALERHTSRRAADFGTLEPWAELWERASSLAFLKSYRETAGDSPILPRGEGAFAALLGAYMVDKSLYELLYELNNRPAWVRIPMLGLLALSESRGDEPHRG